MENLVEEKKIVIKDLLVNYYQVVPANSTKTLIFLHGWRSEGYVWADVMKNLSGEGYTSYALDLPGFGKSQVPFNSYTLSDYCSVVLEFVNKLKIENFSLIGHSFGGRISIKLSSAYSVGELNKVVLVDSAGIFHTSNSTNLMKKIAGIVKPLFKPGFMQPLRRKIYKMIGAEDYLETRYLKDTFVNLVNEDLEPLLPNIKVPTLIVWGKQDDNEYTPLSDAYIMKSKINNSQLAEIDNAKHFSFLDQKEEFINILRNFLNRVK
jgi:pimeloyl-ACP methyl ester carboxylesterase